MYQIKIEEEAFEELVVSYLKQQVAVVIQEFEHMRHPEDKEYNTYLLPALLTVIKYFSIPDEYEKFIWETFDGKPKEDDDDGQQEFDYEHDVNFGGTDE
jgi:hypothetical protein